MNKVRLAQNILTAMSSARSSCPHHAADFGPIPVAKLTSGSEECETAFEMICSTLRFGPNVTAEIGSDLQQIGAKKTMVVSDAGVAETRALKMVVESLTKIGHNFTVFTDVRVEPSDKSMQKAIDFARSGDFDSFVAVGGGSVIDTTKAAALYTANRTASFFDFVVSPFGKWLAPQCPMLPLIAVPTTAGTGSETTATAVFDYEEKHCKTAIRHKTIKPLLALIDPLNVASMPRNVAIYSGFDVLCHALESYTAKPYNRRTPRPRDSSQRPIYQGSNPISDVWVRKAFEIIRRYFRRAVNDPDDDEARSQMLMAASFAGMGFGNAGVHLCHGLSYPISSQVKAFHSEDYPRDHALIPHGLSVVATACADFQFTTPACPQRHAQAVQCLGTDISENASPSLISGALCEQLQGFMRDFSVPNGLGEMGFDRRDVDELAAAAMNSISALQISPRPHTRDIISGIYESSLTMY